VCVVKAVDRAASKVQNACATGQRRSKVERHVVAMINGQSKVTLESRMEDAIVPPEAVGSRASAQEEDPALEATSGMLPGRLITVVMVSRR